MSFNRIAEVEDQVQAFITLNEEEAREQAKKFDEQSSDQKKLFALPVGIKDNIVTKGLRTTSASQFLSNFTDPLYDATAVKKLAEDRKSTRLNSSHVANSYAVFCLNEDNKPE